MSKLDKKYIQLDPAHPEAITANNIFYDTTTTIKDKVDSILSDLDSRYVQLSDYTDQIILNKIKNVDGSDSGLDADLLDGYHASYFAPSEHSHDDKYLSKDNTSPYTPTANYHPATKKYVDDTVINIGAGDMTKAVYDPDDDGSVEMADNADKWDGGHKTISSSNPSGGSNGDVWFKVD